MRKYTLLICIPLSLLAVGCQDFGALHTCSVQPEVIGPPSILSGPSTANQSSDMPMVCIQGQNLFSCTTVTVAGTAATEIQSPDDQGHQLCFRLPMNPKKWGPAEILVQNVPQFSMPVKVPGFSYYLGTPKFLPQAAGKLQSPATALVQTNLAGQAGTDLVFSTTAVKPIEVWSTMSQGKFTPTVSQFQLSAGEAISAIVSGNFDTFFSTQEIALLTSSNNLEILTWNGTDFLFAKQPIAPGYTHLESANLLGNMVPDHILVGYPTQVTALGYSAGSYALVTLNPTIQPNALSFLLSADFDNDKKVDLLTGDSTQVSFYKNTSMGMVTFAAPQTALNQAGFTLSTTPRLAWVANVEKDKPPYLLAAGTSGGQPALGIWPAVTTGMPFGVGTPVPLGNTPIATTTLDVNQDGKLDIVALAGSNARLILQNPAQAGVVWQSPVTIPNGLCTTTPNLVTTLDYNGDKLPDLVVTCQNDANIIVLLNVSE